MARILLVVARQSIRPLSLKWLSTTSATIHPSASKSVKTEKEPIKKWEAIERSREERFGRALSSGRGQSGEVAPEVLRASRSPQSQFRVTGLAYHAWEQKLLEKPLPMMPALDRLRSINATNSFAENSDVLSVLCDIETLSAAFLSVYSRHGSLEDGQQVLQSKAKAWLTVIAQQLQNHTYEFPTLNLLEPGSMDVPKFDATLRDIPHWWHKTVPEAMRMILEAVFEPTFLRSSHGFRPSKGCYTALKEVKYGFTDVDYLLVGDLSLVMVEFDKSVLLNAIRSRISDPVFLQYVEACLRQNYAEISSVTFKSIGIPQTTLLAPILCNIYLHVLDCWFEHVIKCLNVGGQIDENSISLQSVLANRMQYGAERIPNSQAWRSPTLRAVRYVRYGNNLLVGVAGTETDIEQVEVDLLQFIKRELLLDFQRFQFNRALACSPEKEYVVFLGTEVYVAPQISSPGLNPSSKEAGKLPNRPRLCVPARLLLKKLEESGFVCSKRKRPQYCNRLVMWECHEIVKYYDIVMKLFCMYYTFADNYHCLLLLYDVLKQSCSLTLGRKLKLKRMWHVHKRLEKDLVVRDMEGVPLASFERPRFQRPVDPFIGRDINPFVRIERPSRPKFPPVQLGEAFIEPQFPLSKIELSIRSKALQQEQQKQQQQQR